MAALPGAHHTCDLCDSPFGNVTVRHMQQSIHQWAEETFPGRPIHSALVKLFEEIGEVIKEPHKEEEWADVLILWFDLASMHGVDLVSAVSNKMAVNRARKWAVDDNGLMSHIKE